jgi:hypothetical protein
VVRCHMWPLGAGVWLYAGAEIWWCLKSHVQACGQVVSSPSACVFVIEYFFITASINIYI